MLSRVTKYQGWQFGRGSSASAGGFHWALKRTVARSHRASRVRQTRQVNTPHVRRALDARWASLLTTLTKNVHKFWRVPALGAAMAESAVSNFDRLSWARGASLKFSTNARRTRGVFTCRVRRALVDLATVLLKKNIYMRWIKIFYESKS